MLQVPTLRRRSLIGLGWLAMVAVGVLVAVFNIYLAVWLLALVLVGLLAVVVLPAQPRAPRLIAGTAVAQRVVYTPDGAEYSALVVPAEHVDGYQTVLTSTGYRVIDSDGRIVYALKPAG